MSLGLFNCRLIQPTGDQLFFLSAVLPHRCQFGQALFSLLVARPARRRPAGGRRMLLAFPSQKDFAWFSAGAKSRRRQKSSLPPIHPRIFPKIHLTLPIDSAIEPEELSHTRDRRGLLRRHVSRAADEVAHPLRKVDDYLAALLWHSAVPVLCAGRWNSKNSFPRHLQSAGNAPRQPTDGVDPWLGGLRNSGETPEEISLDRQGSGGLPALAT